MLRIALALTFVLAASSAWADEMCPRMAQYQAYVALQQNADDAATVATAETAEPETVETAAVAE